MTTPHTAHRTALIAVVWSIMLAAWIIAAATPGFADPGPARVPDTAIEDHAQILGGDRTAVLAAMDTFTTTTSIQVTVVTTTDTGGAPIQTYATGRAATLGRDTGTAIVIGADMGTLSSPLDCTASPMPNHRPRMPLRRSRSLPATANSGPSSAPESNGSADAGSR